MKFVIYSDIQFSSMTFVHPSENRHEPVSFSTYEDHSTGKDIEERQMKKLNRQVREEEQRMMVQS